MKDFNEFLDFIRCSRKEQMHFFSNEGKAARELWVVKEFLTVLSIPFAETELVSSPQNSQVDVEFRDACFQIKEITDENIRRNDEVKESWIAADSATKIEDLVQKVTGRDIPDSRKGYDLIYERAEELTDEYPLQIRKNLDLLFYITRTRTSLIQPQDIKQKELLSLGWRSISCFMGNHSYVLFILDNVPLFLRQQLIGS